jgi:tRNA modification GTPase
VIDFDGLRMTLVDTAGIRESGDAVEAEGVARSLQAQAVADLVLHVVAEESPSAGESAAVCNAAKFFVVQNKIDKTTHRHGDARVHVSAKTGEGLETLRLEIVRALSGDDHVPRDRPAITNVRHAALMQQAHDALVRARDAACREHGALPEEFLLADLQVARGALEEIAGRRASEDLIEHIFARFCVGK